MDIQKMYPGAVRLIGARGRAMQIIDAGGDVNQRNERGMTPLQEVASKCRNFHVVRALVDKGAEINAVDRLGGTPLSTMLRYGMHPEQLQSVLYLIEHGADTNVRDQTGQETPLEYACRYAVEGRHIVVRSLLDHGAEVNPKSPFWTPLHYAASRGDKEMVQMLLEAGAVSVPDTEGRYPIAVAKDEVKEMFIHAKGAQCSS